MHARHARAAVLLVALAGCLGLGAGAKYYKRGEDAQKAGDLEEARQHYRAALQAEPSNARYKQAVAEASRELARTHRAEARTKEKAQDWAGASAEWTLAAELAPDEQEYQVRRDLSGLKAKNLGPDEWYEAIKTISEKFPTEEVVARTLEGARAAAYQYNVNLGEQFLGTGEGARAFTYFERAKAIDPTTPGLDAEKVAKAEALSMAQEAQKKLDGGDPVGAYDLYTKAFEKVPLPEIKRDMQKAKQKAAAILGKLEQARDKVKKKRLGEALRLYSAILDIEGAPAYIEEEAGKVRQDLIAAMVAEASAKAAKRQLRSAHQMLLNAAAYANLGRVERDTYKAAIDNARDGRPKTALEVLDKVGLDASSPLYASARDLAVASARDQLLIAEKIAKKSPEKALAMLPELEPFEQDVEAIAILKRQLRSGSFQGLLDESLDMAKKGSGAEASSLLLAALNSSQAPVNMRDPALEACDNLKDSRFAAAERAFEQALRAAPKSKLAQRGIEVARVLRDIGERGALEAIKGGHGDLESSVATLEDAISVQPKNAAAKEAGAVLLARAKTAGPDAEAAKLLTFAGRLLATGAARQAIDDGAAKLAASDHAGAEAAFATANGSVVAEAGLELARARMLTALKSGAKKAAVSGDEDSARALAKLLAQDPQNRDAKAAVKSLLEQAAQHASKQDFSDAARYLRLATIATSPAPGVKKELDKANEGLARSDLVVAEKAYADALDIEAGDQVARSGYDIAREARVNGLTSAVAEAKKNGNADRAAEALKKSLEIDPNSAEAKKAFAELLAEAKRQGDEGNDAQAASLLDAANVVSKPEPTKKKIADAIALLGKSEHEKAIAAFDAASADGSSQVVVIGKSVSVARQKTQLLEEAKLLENGSDLTRGATAVAKLRAIDPTDPMPKRAIDAALVRAEKAAATGDDRGAAREIEAAALAVGEQKQASAAIAKLQAGAHQEAEDAFGYGQSTVALVGQKIAKGRRLGTLKAGLSGQGEEAAKAIAALWLADPSNKEARKAYDTLLEDAKKAGKSGDDATAADKLRMASIAASSAEDLATAIDAGAAQLAGGHHAEAEKAFVAAAAINKDSKVAKIGIEISRNRRWSKEREAKNAIAKNGDPRPHAKVLQASLLVDPKSKTVSQALSGLVQRARKAARSGADGETAQVLEAAALLENGATEVQDKLTEGSGLYARGAFQEAEAVFTSVDGNGGGSKVADLGRQLARARRVAVLEAEWREAKKAKDVLRESGVIGQILGIYPDHREAKSAMRRVVKELASNRTGAARTNREAGKLGVAYVYLDRALKLNADDHDAKKEMDDVASKLKERMDLILMVEPVDRTKDVGAKECLGFDEMLRDEIMTVSSQRTDLGGYVLSPGWTKAVEEKSDKAPEVSGSIAVTVTSCKGTPKEGKASYSWELRVPAKGRPVAKGELSADVPNGLIPRDEQDEAGNNVKRALASRATESFLSVFETEREAIDLWLLALAEQAMALKDVASTADAYARLSIKKPASIDPARVAKIEEYLAKELR